MSKLDLISVKFGDSFFVTTVTDAKVMCEDKDKEMDVEIENLSSQLKVLQGEVDVLKKKLYSRFGTQINLEENN